MSIKKQNIVFAALLFLLMPTVIFIIGWYKWYLVVGVLVLLAIISILSYKTICGHYLGEQFEIPIINLFLLFILILGIVVISGIGGFSSQSGDHVARNPVFYDLIFHDWPVIYHQTNTALTYYIGFWLLPAAIAKLFIPFGQNIAWVVGNTALALESALFFFLSALNIYVCIETESVSTANNGNRNKKSYWALLTIPILLLLFAGLNELGSMLLVLKDHSGYLSGFLAQKDWYYHIAYNGNFVAMAYTFNSFFPSLLAASLFYSVRGWGKGLYVVLLLGTVMSAPLPLIGFAAVVVCLGAVDIVRCLRTNGFNGLKNLIFEYLSPINLIALAVTLLLIPYYMGNSLMSIKAQDLSQDILAYLIFCLCEFGIIGAILFRQKKGDALYWISLVLLAAIPWLRLEKAVDWGLRVPTFPLLFLSFFVIELILKSDRRKSSAALMAIAYLSITSMDILADWETVFTHGRVRGTREFWTLRTFEQHQTDESYYYVPQYLTTAPQHDPFFTKMSRADFSQIQTPDVVVEEEKIKRIYYTEQDIPYLEQVLVGDLSVLTALDPSAQGCYTVIDDEIRLRETPFLISEEEMQAEVIVKNTDELQDYLKESNHRTPFFLDVEFINKSPYMIAGCQINKGGACGLAWIIMDNEGNAVHGYENYRFEFNVLPQTSASLKLCISLPKAPGDYRLIINFFQDDNFWGPALFDTTFTIE